MAPLVLARLQVQWFELPSFFVFHVAGSWEDAQVCGGTWSQSFLEVSSWEDAQLCASVRGYTGNTLGPMLPLSTHNNT